VHPLIQKITLELNDNDVIDANVELQTQTPAR
jgi:hypothetical protein